MPLFRVGCCLDNCWIHLVICWDFGCPFGKCYAVDVKAQKERTLSVCRWFAGIGYSDDKLLQTRIFSYADSQRHRLGPNYLLLPANAPKNPHHDNHHEGFMNFLQRDEEVSIQEFCLVVLFLSSWCCSLQIVVAVGLSI